MSRHLHDQRRTPLALLLGLALTLGACGEARESQPLTPTPQATYRGVIEPLLADKCVSCHGKDKQEGSYDLSSWAGLLGPGSDKTKRNAVAGDANSRLLTILSEESHAGILDAAQRKLLLDWVVKDRLAFLPAGNGYHPRGWLDPSDRGALTFHGGYTRAKRWDLRECQQCHGQDFQGGLSKVSCTSCHQKGPTGCSTCHGDGRSGASHPPTSLSGGLDPETDRGVGVHAAHLGGTRFAAVPCSECHRVPSRWDGPGHLFDSAKTRTSDLRAEVVFGPRATNGGAFSATYNRDAGTCRVYCHAMDKKDNVVSWTAPGSVSCGSCHDVPHAAPSPYVGADCTHCHQQHLERCSPGDASCSPTAEGLGVRFTNIGAHGDGKTPLGKAGAEGTCWGCHGTQKSAGAPAPDLDGKSDETSVTVGLHSIHLTASTLFGAVKCADCHIVPKTITAAGHLDSARPAEVVFSDLASGKTLGLDLKPTWDRKTGTCANVYCHSQVGGKVSAWRWTERISSGDKKLGCDSCHGMPPATTLSGQTHPTSKACTTCHSGAFIPGGLIDPAKHINGQVDFQ